MTVKDDRMKGRKVRSAGVRGLKIEKTSTLTKAVLLFLAGILLIEVFVTWNVTSVINEKARPADLEIISISDSRCDECTAATSLSNLVEENNNTNVKSARDLDFSSAEAKNLIDQYQIEKIPAVVATGEFRKDNLVFLWGELSARMLDNAVVIESAPPYVNATNGNKEGLVSLISIVDSTCKDCSSMTSFVDSLKQAGVKITNERQIEYNTPEAQVLISSQNIQRVPAVVLSRDVLAYDDIRLFILQTNGTERQGFYAYHATTPPYLDLKLGKVVGLVSVIYITDNSCSTCYDVTNHRAILERFGVSIANETTYDISSSAGSELKAKYNITKVPTLIFSPDGAYYAALIQVWQTVGTIANDGWFIFRSTEAMGTYKDLSTGQVVSSGS